MDTFVQPPKSAEQIFPDDVVKRRKPGPFQLYYLFLVVFSAPLYVPVVLYLIFWFFGEKTSETLRIREKNRIRLHGRTNRQKIKLTLAWLFAIGLTVGNIYAGVIAYKEGFALYM
jgi:hypothetical protein